MLPWSGCVRAFQCFNIQMHVINYNKKINEHSVQRVVGTRKSGEEEIVENKYEYIDIDVKTEQSITIFGRKKTQNIMVLGCFVSKKAVLPVGYGASHQHRYDLRRSLDWIG